MQYTCNLFPSSMGFLVSSLEGTWFHYWVNLSLVLLVTLHDFVHLCIYAYRHMYVCMCPHVITYVLQCVSRWACMSDGRCDRTLVCECAHVCLCAHWNIYIYIYIPVYISNEQARNNEWKRINIICITHNRGRSEIWDEYHEYSIVNGEILRGKTGWNSQFTLQYKWYLSQNFTSIHGISI